MGDITVLAIAPPATGPPHAVCTVGLVDRVLDRLRQCTLVSGATFVFR